MMRCFRQSSDHPWLGHSGTAVAVAMVIMLTTGVSRASEDSVLRLPAIFSNGMVLQRGLPVKLWGWARPEQTVHVTFAGQHHESSTDETGRWRIELEPLEASTQGRSLVVSTSDGKHRVQIDDVLVGEVWFTAGQSNMMMALKRAAGGPAYYEQHHADTHGLIRVVNQMGPAIQSDEPREDAPARWGQPTLGYSAVSYWFAYKLFEHFDRQIPIGMVTYTAIAGAEAWVDRDTLASDPRLKPVLNDPLHFDAKCYNGVISAVAPYTLRGVVYYQAEYNGFGERALQFRVLMPALIETWRRAWQQPEMPMLFVQLPGFITQKEPPDDIDMDPATLARYRGFEQRRTWAVVRESQLHTWQNVPHTGMAVAIDLGEDYDIHPRNKEPIADRLLLQARRVAYGEDLIHSGPVPSGYEIKGDSVVVSFKHTGSGLIAHGGEPGPFELAGVDAVYHRAEAAIDGQRVIVRSEQVPEPVHVRYAWFGNPQVTLYNREKLPATPFRWSNHGRMHQPGESRFDWPNASFEQANRAGEPIGWRLGPQTTLTHDDASDGERAVAMALPNKSGLFITGAALNPGVYWNAPPTTPVAVRPGCVIQYSFDMKAAQGSGTQKLYANLCQNASGSAYQAWGGTRTASTASEVFVKRTIVQRLADAMTASHFAFADAVGARFIYQGDAEAGGIVMDNLTPVRIARPLLALSHEGAIDLGQVAIGETATSAAITIYNDQPAVFRQILTDDAEAGQAKPTATLLYGVASFSRTAMGVQQKIIDRTNHVGGVILGPDAERFVFVSDHTGDTPRQLKLIGTDGQPGLLGGPDPEQETFAIRFLGSDQPGTSHATLRVVTQAGNIGMLSQGEEDEPPVHLYYVDFSITVAVAAPDAQP